jgi:hypothetical protein
MITPGRLFTTTDYPDFHRLKTIINTVIKIIGNPED